MSKKFSMFPSAPETEEKMPESEMLKYLKNDGYDEHRKKIWDPSITITTYEASLKETELYIKDLINAELNKPVDLNTTFNKPGKGPLEDRVIIWPDEALKVTAGGIQIIEHNQSSPPKGTVVAVGPGIPSKMHNTLVGYLKDGVVSTEFLEGAEPIYKLEEMPLKPGMRVHYGRSSFTTIEDPETKKKGYLIMRLSDVFIKV